MPTYEYRCRDCEHTFQLNRAMAASADPAPCPYGHSDTVKLLSTVAFTGVTAGPTGRNALPVPKWGGGCCGGRCG